MNILVAEEPVEDVKKLPRIQNLVESSEFRRESSRITDIPLMGNAPESV